MIPLQQNIKTTIKKRNIKYISAFDKKLIYERFRLTRFDCMWLIMLTTKISKQIPFFQDSFYIFIYQSFILIFM